MYCTKCGQQIEDNAVSCVHCGTPTGIKPPKKKKPFYKRWWFWLIAIILLMGSCSGSGDSDEPEIQGQIITNQVGVNDDTSAETESAATESIAPAESTEPLIPIYEEGMYKVGSDVPAGEYYVSANAGFRCYFEVSSDSSGSLDSIIANDNIDTFAFITLSEGQYFTVSRGAFVGASYIEVPGVDDEGYYSEGMYRVGIDIEAGEYKVEAINGSSCYIEVSTDSTGTLDSVVTNDNFDTSMYITVSDGQYLTVVRGKFTPA